MRESYIRPNKRKRTFYIVYLDESSTIFPHSLAWSLSEFTAIQYAKQYIYCNPSIYTMQATDIKDDKIQRFVKDNLADVELDVNDSIIYGCVDPFETDSMDEKITKGHESELFYTTDNQETFVLEMISDIQSEVSCTIMNAVDTLLRISDYVKIDKFRELLLFFYTRYVFRMIIAEQVDFSEMDSDKRELLGIPRGDKYITYYDIINENIVMRQIIRNNDTLYCNYLKEQKMLRNRYESLIYSDNQ